MSAYAIVLVRVDDPETYAKYTARTPEIVKKHGGKFVVRGGEVDTIEGEPFTDRLVILEFPTKKAIHDMFSDPEYQTIAEYRLASSEARIFAVDKISE